MSGSSFRNYNSPIRLPLDCIFGQRLRRRPRQHATVEIVAAIMARTPDDRLAWQVTNRATFVRALGAEGQQFLILRLQNDYALPAHRDDDKFILLELGSLFAGQTRWSRGPGLRQRLEITNHRISDTGQPAEDGRAQQKIQKVTARRFRIGSYTGLFLHFGYPDADNSAAGKNSHRVRRLFFSSGNYL